MTSPSSDAPVDLSAQDAFHARRLLAYHLMHHPLIEADVIIVLGSNDPRVADYAADLYLSGWSPVLVCSGGSGVLTHGLYGMSEAEKFADIARLRGVPGPALILETASANTGENVLYTRRRLEAEGIRPKSAIAVQKTYMERRTFATFRKLWPELDVRVCSPPLALEDLALPWINLRDVISVMVGDFQRILVYPGRGFQIPQSVTPEAMESFEWLVAHGYTSHMIGTG